MARHLPIPLGVLAATAMVALLALVPAAEAAGLRIASPRNDRFFAQAPVRVKLQTARSVRSIDATLEGKSVTAAFEPVRPGLWRAELGPRQLRGGVNHLVVTSREGSGRRDYASARFLVGKRKPGFLTLKGPRRNASGLVARVQVAAAPERLIAKLNGKRLRWPLGLATGRSATLRLGADDGLRFGANRVQVFAARRDGVFDLERRTVFVPRTGPLAGAGRDRRAAVGSAVRFDGRRSLAARPGSRLSYRWQIVSKPPGSMAKLRRSASARPRLPADKPGTYRVRLTVTEAGPGGPPRSSSDTATLTSVANLPPIGAPIETIAFNGENTEETADTGIRIGAKTYWMGMPKGNSVQAVILDRSTLELLYAASYPGSQADAETLKAKIKEYGGKALVAISNPDLFPNSGVNAAFVPIVKSLGAPVGSIENGRAGWSVIGVPGAKGAAYFGTGSSYDNEGAGDVRGNLDGYLQATTGKAFAFVPAGRALFYSSAPGSAGLKNTIKVGDGEYPSQPLSGCGSGGFQVEVVLAETLAPTAGETFTTNGCGAGSDATAQQQMASFLAGLSLAGGTAEGSKLVFVQSIGSPYDAAAGSWDKIATALEALGATPSVFATARSSYSLVGGLGIPQLPLTEASETLTGAPARISGMLETNRRDFYVPMLSSPSGVTPFVLNTIAYQPARPWPLSETKEEKAALAYAAELLKLEAPALGSACYVPSRPDVRSEYCNLEYRNEWSGFATKLEGAKYVAGHGFSKEVWRHVVKQLASEEFDNVQSVWNLVTTLQGAFGASGVSAEVNLNKIATEIENAIAPPARSEAAGWWLELVANFGSIASYYSFGLEEEVAQKTTGTLSGALFIAAQLIFGPQGAPEAEDFKLSTDDVAVDLAERYLAASNGIGRVGELLVSDYGRLKAIAAGGALGIDSKTVEELTTILGPGSKQWTYQNLLPTTYEAIGLEEGEFENKPLPANATEYSCEYYVGDHLESTYRPFGKAPTSAQLAGTEPTRSLGLLVRAGSELPNHATKAFPRSPTKELMEPLFKSEEKGGLGFFAPWFWRSAFEYPSANTKKVRCG